MTRAIRQRELLQVAALCWRKAMRGEIEILLITTRETKRWVIPKGWPMDDTPDHAAAAIEAFEEAGVKGVMLPTPIGSYGYRKSLRADKSRKVHVDVYALEVHAALDDWPERGERQRRWVGQSRVADLLGEPELLPVIVGFVPQQAVGVEDMSLASVGFFQRWRARLRLLFK